MTRKTTKVRAGHWGRSRAVVAFCTEQFGAGGIQADRRWFYRLLGGEFKTVRVEGHDFRVAASHDYTAVYFRYPADAVWFNLKFGVDHGHV